MFGAPITITPPTGELISAERARSYLRVDGSAFDDEIDLIRAAAVEDVEQQTGLRMLNQTVKVSADSFDDLALFRVGPVREVTSIAYRDVAGADQLMVDDSFDLFGAELEQGVRAVDQWPMAAAGSIVVTLEVGYGTDATNVPNQFVWAAYRLLRAKFEGSTVDISALINGRRFWL